MPNGELSAEQRARISHNFRAAKALLARKRPRLDAVSHKVSDETAIRTPVRACDRIERLPLAEIPTNTTSPITRFESPLSFEQIGGGPVCRDSGADRIGVVPVDIGFDSFVTPVKRPECSRLSDSLSVSGVLDDDEEDDSFDEAVLEEIDAFCKRRSMEKLAGSALSTKSVHGIDREDNNGCAEPKVGLEHPPGDNEMENEAKLEPGNCDELKMEGLIDSQSLKIGKMPEDYSKYMLALNDKQLEAACYDISTPLMIKAGPGSGKTSTMVGRVLMLLHEGISPSNILAMTFTTAAVAEMRERIGKVAGKTVAKELTISTFHSFSLQLCRSHAEKLGRTPEFLIYGQGQQRRAVIEAVRLLESDKSDKKVNLKITDDEPRSVTSPQLFKDSSKKWQQFVTRAKASGKSPEDCSAMGDETGAAILRNYNDILRTCNALDYHDLISCSVKLLTEYPEVFEECQESWKAIVVDEFQDTSTMQYNFLKILASHNHITIVGDDDQSIFSFNGADSSGFDLFCKDFPGYKEVRLNRNYRSTRQIIEAASSVIQNNMKRCRLKNVDTDVSSGSKVIIKECYSEDAQCAFVIDKILEMSASDSSAMFSYGSIAILYRRQISGKVFQAAFRERKIPFNTHGVAFYRKKIVRAIIAMLRSTLPGCGNGEYRQVFKTLLPFEKEEKKRVIEHIEKISVVRNCSFFSAASDIFSAKLSGTFKRSQLTQGRKVLQTLDMISKLVHREQSISAVITSVANMVPQRYLLEKRAVIDVDAGKYLNEENDIRSVLQYLLDDVSEFLSNRCVENSNEKEALEEKGCFSTLKAFIDHVSERESENFRSRREDNKNSITLTTMHQSKGLEWDMVFIVKANESEIPLLHEFNGVAKENGTSLEEERRLFYVAMTRARKKLFALYVSMDSNFQILRPSRFLKEIPEHLREVQGELSMQLQEKHQIKLKNTGDITVDNCVKAESCEGDEISGYPLQNKVDDGQDDAMRFMLESNGNSFLKRFNVEERSTVSHVFHQWAKKRAFQEPKRLLDKVGFVIDERLRAKNTKNKDVLRSLKSYLKCDEAFQFAEHVLRWEKIPAETRAHFMREKQEHFQKLRIENSMGSSAPTDKQISFLQSLGCTVVPSSRLHASHLIEQYKSL